MQILHAPPVFMGFILMGLLIANFALSSSPIACTVMILTAFNAHTDIPYLLTIVLAYNAQINLAVSIAKINFNVSFAKQAIILTLEIAYLVAKDVIAAQMI